MERDKDVVYFSTVVHFTADRKYVLMLLFLYMLATVIIRLALFGWYLLKFFGNGFIQAIYDGNNNI